MNKPKFYLLLVLVLLPLACRAENSVNFPTGTAAWTIDVTESQSPKKSITHDQGNITRVDVSQNEQFRCSFVTYKAGVARPFWGVPGTNMIMTKDSNGTPFITPPTAYFAIPFSPSLFDWVNKESLAEKTPVTYEGKLCYHYKSVAGETWIDSKTAFPVAYDDGQSLAKFTLLAKPAEPPVLPPEFKQLLAGYLRFTGKKLPPVTNQ